ncbi:MAG: hypothetical protein HFG26_09485 [Provencibacterium sp.]|jgi:ABC-2 type transport system permease protein|nr:hypothetical protein [Provencibacterium sp.]
MHSFHKYLATVRLSAAAVFDGSLLPVMSEYLVRFLQLALLLLVWRSLAAAGADLGGMTLPQLLSYTLLASVLRQQLEIVTPATSALWEGSIVGRYLRPMPLLGGLAAETVGRWWLPVFLFYSLPVLLLAPIFGISPLPVSLAAAGAFLLSLSLSVSLGFALDFLFASLAIRMKNGCWAANDIREAMTALFTGALIPFSLMPPFAGRILALLPTGSVASAPLLIYVGAAENAPQLIGLQLFWNAVLWPFSLWAFHKSEERMISYGG